MWRMRHAEEGESTIGRVEGFQVSGDPSSGAGSPTQFLIFDRNLWFVNPDVYSGLFPKISTCPHQRRLLSQAATHPECQDEGEGCHQDRLQRQSSYSVAASTAGLPSSRRRFPILLRMVLSAASAISMTSPIWP